ncbi:hypothetical protein BGW36DRAFT_295889 [Talaromyces proteolyticus]|uniref:BZIP domain-containing protein n=1 Tax=Talaromyces proteolyticus TaxID=1131652 RepID=A0AAD4KPC1_9EURO|nr:uncharacterized protein BGW36DRAFT_295889 [Talaromyces proteolyticus]KAH8697373.1 hypothetical protein BGW36DRAFT_295889 [Talaromyces proteolyticus]
MSDSGDSVKMEQKREYNRNAQRLFRQRRKEHLKNLERAEQERASNHAEEVERLRQEISELRSENDHLHVSLSPSRQLSATPSVAAITSSPQSQSTSPFPTTLDLYDPGYGAIVGDSLPTVSHDVTPSNASELDTSPFCLLFPYDIATLRRELHEQLAAVLDMNVLSHPQLHLSTLAAIGPSLPPPLRPTLLQLQTPHHAYIDLIPSPTLRDLLIQTGFETANAFLTEVCTFVYETEDLGQLTIWGQDYLNEMSWEFSEAVLKAWPGLLTAEWRVRANFWRRQRNQALIELD